MHPQIAIIVLSYNGLNVTKKFLNDLYNNTENFSIIMIDNGSTDGTKEYLLDFAKNHHNMLLTLNENNAGVINGRNQGYAIYKTMNNKPDLFMFLDNDQYVQKGWLEQHYDVMEHGAFDIVGVANGSQPTVDQRGKIFIPVRMHQDSTDLNEPLISMDGFAWKAKYGSWNFDSDVVITNSSQEVIDSTTYRIYPRDGIVVFSSKQNGPLYISIENSGNLRLGIRIINKIATDPVRIYGFGFLYNTNIFLPSPLSEKPPSATDIKILPELPLS